MLVFTGHTILSFGSPANLAPLQFGGTGVDLFFVLSGWLIGNQLFIEKNRFGNIQIGRFWIRRWMRTMPAYYAVLGFTILQLYLTKQNFQFPWAHLFFLQNYIGDLSVFYVSWSLSVEEQFYLFIAPFVAFLLYFNRVSQVLLLVALLLSPSLFRFLDLYSNYNETHVRLDCCAMGICLAYVKHQLYGLWQSIGKYITICFIISVSLYLFFYIARYNPDWLVPAPDKLLLACLFGVWIVWSDHTKFSSDGLLSGIVLHVSTRSYAMYLLHVDALAICKKFISDSHFAVYYAAALFLTLIMSEVLFRAVEKPIMKSRKAFNFSKSRTRTDSPLDNLKARNS